MKILVVDDSAVMRKIVVKILADAGYPDVIEAVNGKDALSKASDVDIVFTDWNMPVMDGLTFAKELRKSSTVPVIMVTTEGGQAQVLEAMRAGVNDYIVKPYGKSTLLGKLELLASSRLT